LYVSKVSPKIYSRELVEIIFTQPYSRIGNVVDAGISNRVTASKYLKELVKMGVLKEIKSGREKIHVNDRFLKLLASDTHEFDAYSAH